MARILLLGCGYVGTRLAQVCRAHGDLVSIVSRSADRIRAQNIADSVFELNWCEQPTNWNLPPVDHVVCCVSHRLDESDTAPRNDHATGLSNLLSSLPSRPQRIVYLSTTGVYSDRVQGEWVDEESEVEPLRPGTQNARNGEVWLTENFAAETIILRPAGIYGPDRIPNLEALRSGSVISAQPDSFLNLIHVDDLADCIYQVLKRESLEHQVYNVADGNPVRRKEYYQFICQTIDAPEPIFADSCTDPNEIKVRSRSQGNKRISVNRLRNEQLCQFRYDSYRLGLQSLLQKPNRDG